MAGLRCLDASSRLVAPLRVVLAGATRSGRRARARGALDAGRRCRRDRRLAGGRRTCSQCRTCSHCRRRRPRERGEPDGRWRSRHRRDHRVPCQVGERRRVLHARWHALRVSGGNVRMCSSELLRGCGAAAAHRETECRAAVDLPTVAEDARSRWLSARHPQRRVHHARQGLPLPAVLRVHADVQRREVAAEHDVVSTVTTPRSRGRSPCRAAFARGRVARSSSAAATSLNARSAISAGTLRLDADETKSA